MVPLIFAGNAWVVRNAAVPCTKTPGPCQCVVKIVTASQLPGSTASCSVKVSWTPYWTPNFLTTSPLQDCEIVDTESRDYTIMCDKDVVNPPSLTCMDKPKAGMASIRPSRSP